MKTKKSLMTRLTVAKGLGFLIGLFAFFMIPVFGVNDLMLRWGVFLWYATFGGIVGLMGLMTYHPLWTEWKFPAWFRGIFIGAWLNFVMVFFAHDQMETVLANANFMGMTSPWWFVLEGALIGLIIDLLATKYGGEGKAIL